MSDQLENIVLQKALIKIDNGAHSNLLRFALPAFSGLYVHREQERQRNANDHGYIYTPLDKPVISVASLSQSVVIDIVFEPLLATVSTNDQIADIDDRTVDVFDIISNLILKRAFAPKNLLILTTDEMLTILGAQKIKAGSGQRGGYRYLARKRLNKDVALLESIWLSLQPKPSSKGYAPNSDGKRVKHRLFAIMSKVEVVSKQGSYISSFQIEIGDAFAKLLSSRPHTADIPIRLLQYDPCKYVWEKRIGKYFYRFSSRNHNIRSILTSCRLFSPSDRKDRVRSRFNAALNRLIEDGVILHHQYDSTPDMRSPSWFENWLDSSLTVVLPPKPT